MGGVGLLLVVVLTGGLFWLSPVDPAARTDPAQPLAQPSTAAFEYVAGEPAARAAAGGGEGQSQVTGSGLGVGVEVAGSDAAAGAHGAAAGAADPAAAPSRALPRVTLAEPAPATPAAAPAVRAITTSSARTDTARANVAPAAAVRTPSPAPAVTPAAEPAPARTTLAKLTPPALHEFWVQVGSFASRQRADALGRRLGDQGIVSRVTTRTSGAEVFFRVRVGPYASRAEAEKFLAWVKQVDGMDGSYISAVRNAGG